MLISVPEIAEQLNGNAASLAPELLPNGHRSGNKWMASGIDDTGRSASLAVNLSGAAIGHWTDYGNAHADEQKGDMIDLIRLVLCGGDMGAAVAEAKRRLNIEDSFVPGARPDPAAVEKRAAEARARARRREADDLAEKELKAKRARALFLSGSAIEGTPAEAYLRARGLNPGPAASATEGKWPGSLRFHGEVWHKSERCKVKAVRRISTRFRAAAWFRH